MSDGDSFGRGAEIAGQAAGAAVGAVFGGPVGAIIGAAATPPLTDLVGRAWNELRGRRETNAVQVVDHAAQHAHMGPDHLLDVALADPNLSRLLHAALQTAAATLDQEKIEALARCLANGVEDVARVDEEALIVRALADLDPVHVRVLAKLATRRMKPRDVQWFLTGDIDARRFLEAADLSGPVLAVLERHGLVEESEKGNESRGGAYDQELEVETRFKCTQFGQLCLQRLGHGKGPAVRAFLKERRGSGDKT
jgi:hypothetical protein